MEEYWKSGYADGMAFSVRKEVDGAKQEKLCGNIAAGKLRGAGVSEWSEGDWFGSRVNTNHPLIIITG